MSLGSVQAALEGTGFANAIIQLKHIGAIALAADAHKRCLYFRCHWRAAGTGMSGQTYFILFIRRKGAV